MKNLDDLIHKYNKAVPRYTSYPPVPYWENVPNQNEWFQQINLSYNPNTGIDLYVHVPFCEKLCYYCGCNRIITKNHSVEESFVEHILYEWNIYLSHLKFMPKINSIHFGGGTPNFLNSHHFRKIFNSLALSRTSNFSSSVEIDPRTIDREKILVFKDLGIKKVSLGIQDFNMDVQAAINREQSFDLISDTVNLMRENGISTINFDLIYGLPKQSVLTIEDTFKKVNKIRPDTIAFYSYAHLPDKIKNQKLINTCDLPRAEEKRLLYITGKKILEDNGYEEIGMDHFALPGSFLHKAMIDKKLQRNFMGYVEEKSNILIGLGPTAISDSGLGYIQNIKELEKYKLQIRDNKLAIESGHTLTEVDILAQECIQDLMCNREIIMDKIEKNLNKEEIKKDLNEFIVDGIVWVRDGKLVVPPNAMGFVRNIAQVFDYRHREKVIDVKFSQSI